MSSSPRVRFDRPWIATWTSHQIPDVWDRVKDWLIPAIKRGDRTVERVYKDLCLANNQLWGAWKGGEVIGALVTSLEDDYCLLLACGGKDMDSWIDCIQDVESWAVSKGCKKMRIYGRRGWAKVLNYNIVHTKMEKWLDS